MVLNQLYLDKMAWGPLLANPLATQQSNTAVPQQLDGLIKNILQQLPSSKTLSTSVGLKQALANSGLLFESKLKQAVLNLDQQQLKNQLSKDFKANLIRLLNLLRAVTTKTSVGKQTTQTSTTNTNQTTTQAKTASSAPLLYTKQTGKQVNTSPMLRGAKPIPQPTSTAIIANSFTSKEIVANLLQQTLASIARVQLSQLSSLATDTQPQTNIMLEIPATHNDQINIFQFQIEKRIKAIDLGS